MGEITIFAMRENVLNLYNELEQVSTYLAESAGNPKVSMDDINKAVARQGDLQKRHDIAAQALGRAEDAQRRSLEQNKGGAADPALDKAKAFAGFIRAMRGGDQKGAHEFLAKLGAIPEGSPTLGGGENLLPTNMTNELISEPMDTNQMRTVVGVSNVTNLEMPKIAYTLDDDDFIDDETVAKELKLAGDKVRFGRNKFKVFVAIADTVIYGTETNLQGYTRSALQSGLATKEKKVMFATTPKTGEEHMSFYSTQNNIKKITGASMYDGIVKALGDLHDLFAENAVVVMRRADYMEMIIELANDNATLWGAKPQDVLGVPVIFCDRATTPIVGDMRYVRINYDLPLAYDEDKDAKSGDFLFVITAWFDVQFLLKSAFRLVQVAP